MFNGEQVTNVPGSKDFKEIFQVCLVKLCELKKCHGQLTPDNISYRKKNGKLIVTFGKPNRMDQLIESNKNVMWVAPEIHHQKRSKQFTPSSDLFSLGLYFHHEFTGGSIHPFKILYSLENNELKCKGSLNLIALKNMEQTTESVLAVDLIEQMIQLDPERRPTCEEMMDHAFFWNYSKFKKMLIELHTSYFVDNNHMMKRSINISTSGFLEIFWNQEETFLHKIRELYKDQEFKVYTDLIDFFVLLVDENNKRTDTSIPENNDGMQQHQKLSQILGLDNNAPIEAITDQFLKELMKSLPFFMQKLYNLFACNQMRSNKLPTGEVDFQIITTEVLGKGSSGTVYKGKFQGRNIAVKMVYKSHNRILEREIYLMEKIDAHPNIVRLFGIKRNPVYNYIGLELCDCNLEGFLTVPTFEAQRMLISFHQLVKNLTEGLNHLHKYNIVHRDIKPANILITKQMEDIVLKLSDFGCSKSLNETIFHGTMDVVGTPGWIPPEIMNKSQKHSKQSDVFSLGKVFKYVNETNGLKNEQQILTENLLNNMCDFIPDQRPTTNEILEHIFFWNGEKKLKFLIEVQGRTKGLDPQEQKELVKILNDVSFIMPGWKQALHKKFIASLVGAYKFQTLTELLRAIRNKWCHKDDMTPSQKSLFGSNFNEDSYLKFFLDKYPDLVLYVYEAVKKTSKKSFDEFFYINPQKTTVQPVDFGQPKNLEITKQTLKINFKECGEISEDFELKPEIDTLELCDLNNIFCMNTTDMNSLLKFLAKHGNQFKTLSLIQCKIYLKYVYELMNVLKDVKNMRVKFCKFDGNIMNTDCSHVLEEFEIYDSQVDPTFFLATKKTISLDVEASQPIKFMEKETELKHLVLYGSINPFHFDKKLVNYQLEELSMNLTLLKRVDNDYCALLKFVQTQNQLESFSLRFDRDVEFSRKIFKHVLKIKRLEKLDIKVTEYGKKYFSKCIRTNESVKTLSLEVSQQKKILNVEVITNIAAMLPNLKEYTFNGHPSDTYDLEILVGSFRKLQFLEEIKISSVRLIKNELIQSMLLPNITLFHLDAMVYTGFSLLDIIDKFYYCTNLMNLKIICRFHKNFDNHQVFEFLEKVFEKMQNLKILYIAIYSENNYITSVEDSIKDKILKYAASSKTLKKWNVLGYESERWIID